MQCRFLHPIKDPWKPQVQKCPVMLWIQKATLSGLYYNSTKEDWNVSFFFTLQAKDATLFWVRPLVFHDYLHWLMVLLPGFRALPLSLPNDARDQILIYEKQVHYHQYTHHQQSTQKAAECLQTLIYLIAIMWYGCIWDGMVITDMNASQKRGQIG